MTLTLPGLQIAAVPIAHQPVGSRQKRQASGNASNRAKASEEEAHRASQAWTGIRGTGQRSRSAEDRAMDEEAQCIRQLLVCA